MRPPLQIGELVKREPRDNIVLLPICNSLQLLAQLPDVFEMVSEDVLLCGGKVLSSGALQALDVLLSHVDEQRQVGGVAPKADLGELVEDELTRFELFVLVGAGLVVEWVCEALRQLKDGRA